MNNELRIMGRVVRGDGYGRKIGFPTANIDRRDYSRQGMQVKFGVYGGTVTLPSGKNYPAAVVIGPLDKQGLPKLEAHVLGFTGSLYGKKIIIGVGKYLRPFKKFKSEGELKKQIKKDIAKVKIIS